MIDVVALKSKLTNGEVNLTFTKKDGTIRFMKCTLQESVLPPAPEESKRKPNPEVLSVWDLEKNAWRSVRIDSITEIND